LSVHDRAWRSTEACDVRASRRRAVKHSFCRFTPQLVAWLCACALSQAQAEPPAASAPNPSQTGSELARTLFGEGRALIERGRPAEACERLKRSQELALAIGTLLNLGLCHRHSGLLASAKQYYERAEALAATSRDLERVELARVEVAALERLVGTLTITVSERANPALEVWLDDVSQPRQRWGSSIAVDAGRHTIVARAVGRVEWQAAVDTRDGVASQLNVPVLAQVSEPGRVGLRTASLVTAGNSGGRADTGIDLRSATTLALASAGIAGVGLGVAYMVLARNAFDNSNPHCTARDVCDLRGIALRDDARAHATRATVAISVGAAVLGAAAIWIALPAETPAGGTRSLGAIAGPGFLRATLAGTL
jgi:hypothetical protein